MDTIFGNSNSTDVNHRLPWQPEPDRRGTFSILSTCLITLGLCIWSAIHLHLPARNETPAIAICALPEWLWIREVWPWNRCRWPGQYARRFGWMLLGFLAPELVAFAAFQQYGVARSLTVELRRQFSIQGNDTEALGSVPRVRRNEWTIVHSYFVVMGGLEVLAESKEFDFLPRSRAYGELRKGLRLTPEGFRILADQFPHLVPDEPREKLEDKSKGDSIAKAFVCVQSLWFCAQCFARVIQGMGISLLELNTFGHALCALLIYCVWWNKPLDIQEPEQIWLRGKEELRLVAAMCATSKLDRRKSEWASWETVRNGLRKATYHSPDGIIYHWGMENYLQRLPYVPEPLLPKQDEKPDSEGMQDGLFFPVISSGLGRRRKRWVMGLGTKLAHPVLPLAPGETGLLETEGYLLKSYLPSREGVFDNCLPETKEPRCPPGFRRLAFHTYRLEECEGVFLEDIVDQRLEYPETLQPSGEVIIVDVPEGDFQRWKLLAQAQSKAQEFADNGVSLLSDRLHNFPRLEAILENKWLCLWLTITGLAYGGLHCLAWNASFPNDDQQLFWRMSSPAVASTGVLVLLFFSWEYSPPYWRGDEARFSAENWPWIGESVGGLKRSHWIAKVAFLPFEVIVKLVKMLLDFFIIPGIVLFYCMARVFLVVECFITLNHLPASMYNVPSWSKYVPHIS